jgi:hypothetical protein
MWNAFLIVTASWVTSFTRKLCFTQGRVMPTVSHSWNASSPMARVGTWPVITTIGIESMKAVAMPVTAFVTPGPLVTSATPGLPVARAYPSAACSAPCSWRTSTCFTAFCLKSAS